MVRLMSTDGGFLRAWTLKIPCHEIMKLEFFFENQWLHHDFLQVFFFKVMSTKTKFPPTAKKLMPNGLTVTVDILRPH